MDTLLFASRLMEGGVGESGGAGGSNHHQFQHEPQNHFPHEPQQEHHRPQSCHHQQPQPQQHNDFETLQMALDMMQEKQQQQRQHDDDKKDKKPPPQPPSSNGSPPTLLLVESSLENEEADTANTTTNPTSTVDTTSENATTVPVATTSNNDSYPNAITNTTTSISPNHVMDTLLFASQTLESGTFETAQLEVLQDLKHVKPYAEEIAAHTKHKRGMAALLSWYARLNDFIDFKAQHGHGTYIRYKQIDPNPSVPFPNLIIITIIFLCCRVVSHNTPLSFCFPPIVCFPLS